MEDLMNGSLGWIIRPMMEYSEDVALIYGLSEELRSLEHQIFVIARLACTLGVVLLFICSLVLLLPERKTDYQKFRSAAWQVGLSEAAGLVFLTSLVLNSIAKVNVEASARVALVGGIGIALAIADLMYACGVIMSYAPVTLDDVMDREDYVDDPGPASGRDTFGEDTFTTVEKAVPIDDDHEVYVDEEDFSQQN